MFIQVENLTKKFKNSLAVDKINFQVSSLGTLQAVGSCNDVTLHTSYMETL